MERAELSEWGSVGLVFSFQCYGHFPKVYGVHALLLC